MINSTRELAEAIFDMPVKIGMPMGFGAGLVKEIESPVYATAVGLVLYAFNNPSSSLRSFTDDTVTQEEEEQIEEYDSQQKKEKIIDRMKNWFEQL